MAKRKTLILCTHLLKFPERFGKCYSVVISKTGQHLVSDLATYCPTRLGSWSGVKLGFCPGTRLGLSTPPKLLPSGERDPASLEADPVGEGSFTLACLTGRRSQTWQTRCISQAQASNTGECGSRMPGGATWAMRGQPSSTLTHLQLVKSWLTSKVQSRGHSCEASF